MTNSTFRKNIFNVALEGKLHKIPTGYLMELKDGIEVPSYLSKALQIYVDKNEQDLSEFNTWIAQYQTTREPPYIKLDKVIGLDNQATVDEEFTIKCKVFGVYKNIKKLYGNNNFMLVKLKHSESEDFVKLKTILDDNIYSIPDEVLNNLVTRFVKLTLKRYDSNLIITNLELLN